MRPIPAREYYHEQDKQALDALKAIPGFTAVLKAFMKVFNEKMMHGVNMASKIRICSGQLPEIYAYLPPICEALGVNEPELYLEENPRPNAYTYGDTQAFITVTTGLLEHMTEDGVKAVLAHEVGHIACRHVLYHTMADMILNGGDALLGLGMLAIPIKLAFFHWQRCGEFSCDRAAALYMKSSDIVVDVMLRLAGGTEGLADKIDAGLYINQADDYLELIGTSAWNRTLQYLALMNRSHPFLSVRSAEIKKWSESDHFSRLIDFAEGKQGEHCHFCGETQKGEWKFCRRCGQKR